MECKAEKINIKDVLILKIVNPDVAGIDIANGEMQVCVPKTLMATTIAFLGVLHATTKIYLFG